MDVATLGQARLQSRKDVGFRARRSGYRLSLPTSAASAGTETEMSLRSTLQIPVSSTRWRLHVRNWQPRSGAAYTGAIDFTGMWIGEADFTTGTTGGGDSYGRPSGIMTAAPVQALPAFSTPADGSEYVSGWVTAGGAQVAAGKTHLLSYGFTKAAGSIARSLGAYQFTSTSAGASAAGVAGAAALPTGMAGGGTGGYFDMWIEYEFLGTQRTAFFLTDSIGAGVGQPSSTNYVFPKVAGNDPTQTFPHRWAMLANTPVALAGAGGLGMAEITATTNGMYAMLKSLADAGHCPEIAVVELGSNDVTGSQSWTSTNVHILRIAGHLRSFGIKRVYFCTMIPRIQLGGSGGAVDTGHGKITAAVTSGTASITTDFFLPTQTRFDIDWGASVTEQFFAKADSVDNGNGTFTTSVTTGSNAGTSVNFANAHAVGATVWHVQESNRRAFNNVLLGGAYGVDGVIDIARGMADPSDSFQLDPNLRASDKIHLRAAGGGRIANMIPPGLAQSA